MPTMSALLHSSIGPQGLRFSLRAPKPSQLKHLPLQRSSQTFANPNNISQLHRPIPFSQPPISRRFYDTLYRSHPSISYWHTYKGNVVTGGIIGLCVAGYAGHWYAENRETKYRDLIDNNFICSLKNWREGRWWTTLTSSLMHATLVHLGVNMMALWSIGPSAISLFGVPRFLALWVVTGAACSAASLSWQSFQQRQRKSSVGRRWDAQGIRENNEVYAWIRWIRKNAANSIEASGGVGASGSILGAFTAFACLAPKSSMSLFFVPMPSWLWGSTFVAGSVYCMLSNSLPFIGHAGHLGGMAGGAVCYFALLRRPMMRRLRF